MIWSNHFFRRSFYLYFLIVILPICIVLGFFYTSANNIFHKDMKNDVNLRMLYIQSQIQGHLNEPELSKICVGLSNNVNFKDFSIMRNGEILWSSGANLVGFFPEYSQLNGINIHNKNGKYIGITSIFSPQDKILVIATFSNDELSLKPLSFLIFCISVVLVILSLGFIYSKYIAKQAGEAINIARDNIHLMATGDFDYQGREDKNDGLEEIDAAVSLIQQEFKNKKDNLTEEIDVLQSILLNMEEGVIVLDMNEYIKRMNNAACIHFDLPVIDYKNYFLRQIVRNGALQKLLEKTFKTCAFSTGEISLQTKNGEKTLRVYISPLQYLNKKLLGYLLVMSDVTKLRRLENSRKDFVANVSHEIKTPLTIIHGYSEALHDGAFENPEKSLQFTEAIMRNINQLSSLVDDLLQLSSIEAEDANKLINVEKISLVNILEDVIKMCQSKLDKKNMSLQLDVADISIFVSNRLFTQAIRNILENAINYGPEKSIIFIKLTVADDIIISIRDQGIGIAKQHLGRIFERFYRVDKARSRDMGGTGLGLSIVKHIINIHGGRTWAESNIGSGATFYISIPNTNNNCLQK